MQNKELGQKIIAVKVDLDVFERIEGIAVKCGLPIGAIARFCCLEGLPSIEAQLPAKLSGRSTPYPPADQNPDILAIREEIAQLKAAIENLHTPKQASGGNGGKKR